MKKIFIKIIIVIIIITVINIIIVINNTNAQTIAPRFLISWRAQSYAPAWYQGKILATRGSWVDASFELIEKGKIIDLSKKKVRWYVNDDLRRNEDDGLGIKNYSFTLDDLARDDVELRIVIVDYSEDGDEIGQSVIIPLASPEVVIDAPYSASRVPSGTSYFKAHPFFFNIRDLSKLSFNWSVGGRPAESNAINTSVLKLNIDKLAPSGFGLDIQATINNLMDEMEFASKRIKMKVK